MNRRRPLMLLVAALLMSCAPSVGCDPVSRVGESADTRPVHLYVSNQSFEIDPVLIEVFIDVEPVVCQEFLVEGQHNWILFELEVAPGIHTLRAVGNEGAAQSEQPFEVTGEQWAVVDFWFYPDDPPQKLTVTFQDEPILFA